MEEDAGGNDSSTHWLERCSDDADCGDLSCLCGVCSRSCEEKADCSALSSAAVCDERSDCATQAPLCLLECNDEADCGGNECEANQCVGIGASRDGGPSAGGTGGSNSPEQDSGGGPGQGGDGSPPATGGAAATSSPGTATPSVPAMPTSPNLAELCDDPMLYFGRSMELDLTGALEARRTGTAEACLGDGGAPACCNWTFTAYVLPCPTGDVVLSVDGTPFGSKAIETFHDDFHPQDSPPREVSIGCEGLDCAPTCVPENTEAIQRVRARLEPAERGEVVPKGGSEPFPAIAALVVEADLSGTPMAEMPTDECSMLEANFMDEWSLARACEADGDCYTDYSGLCTVEFSEGTRFSCDLALNASASTTELRSIEEQYRTECQPAADCDCQPVPSACVDEQCTTLFEPRTEADLDVCAPGDFCTVVPYDHCCGLTRRAINSVYQTAYEAHPEWQRIDECDPAAGACASDEQLTSATCQVDPGARQGRCVLRSTVPP